MEMGGWAGRLDGRFTGFAAVRAVFEVLCYMWIMNDGRPPASVWKNICP